MRQIHFTIYEYITQFETNIFRNFRQIQFAIWDKYEQCKICWGHLKICTSVPWRNRNTRWNSVFGELEAWQYKSPTLGQLKNFKIWNVSCNTIQSSQTLWACENPLNYLYCDVLWVLPTLQLPPFPPAMCQYSHALAWYCIENIKKHSIWNHPYSSVLQVLPALQLPHLP